MFFFNKITNLIKFLCLQQCEQLSTRDVYKLHNNPGYQQIWGNKAITLKGHMGQPEASK